MNSSTVAVGGGACFVPLGSQSPEKKCDDDGNLSFLRKLNHFETLESVTIFFLFFPRSTAKRGEGDLERYIKDFFFKSESRWFFLSSSVFKRNCDEIKNK